jgi:ubiquinone/menaquinone biosynthesis C-methylase UbiE
MDINQALKKMRRILKSYGNGKKGKARWERICLENG